MTEKISTREQYNELAAKIRDVSQPLTATEESKIKSMLLDYERKHIHPPPVLPVKTGTKPYLFIFPLLFIASIWFFFRDSSPEAVSVMAACGLLAIVSLALARWLTFTNEYVKVRSLFGSRSIPWSNIKGYSVNDSIRQHKSGLIFLRLNNGRSISLVSYLHTNVDKAEEVIMLKAERIPMF